MTRPVLLIVVNQIEFFLSHRLPIALKAKSSGFEVHVAAAIGTRVADIRNHGLIFHEIPITRSGVNLLAEFRSFLYIVAVMRRVKPDIVHLVTIKPVLYGGIAAKVAGVRRIVAAISGMGHAYDRFRSSGFVYRNLFMAVYRVAMAHRSLRVIFQNESDLAALVKIAHLPNEKCVLIKGSGVDLDVYRASPENAGQPVVLFASRLLRNKGVIDFVEAATLLKSRGFDAKFLVAGSVDEDNPESIGTPQLEKWKSEAVVEVLGPRHDIPELIASSHLVVLPSYYGEGLPKVLVEAAACGRAVITTDHPGCRDAIENGISGILVPTRNPVALSEAIERLGTNRCVRQKMGEAGRALAEREYSVSGIAERHLEIYRELLAEN